MGQRHSLEKRTDQKRGLRQPLSGGRKSPAPRTAESTVIDLQHKVGNRAFGELLDADLKNVDHEAWAEPPLVKEVLRSAGSPMSSAVRANMEARFQEDFHDV